MTVAFGGGQGGEGGAAFVLNTGFILLSLFPLPPPWLFMVPLCLCELHLELGRERERGGEGKRVREREEQEGEGITKKKSFVREEESINGTFTSCCCLLV